VPCACTARTTRTACTVQGVRAVALVAGVAFLLASVVLQSVLQVPPPITRHQVSAGEPVLLSQRSLPLMNSMV
jgi:hypothetical protein